MDMMKKLPGITLGAACILPLLIGCSTTAPLPRADYVDLERFMGAWYVMGYTPIGFDKMAHNAVEHYAQGENNTILTIIAHPGRKYAWIMTREPHVSENDYQALLQRLVEAGYDAGIMKRLPHDWSGEKERLDLLERVGRHSPLAPR